MVNTKPRAHVATVELQLPAEFRVEFEHTPGTPNVPHLINGDPGRPGENPLCTVTDIKGMWLGDHLVTDTASFRHVMESFVRSPEYQEEIQKQLLTECEVDDDKA